MAVSVSGRNAASITVDRAVIVTRAAVKDVLLAELVVPANAPQGKVTAPWTNLASGYTAANAPSPSDPPSVLRVPRDPPAGAFGLYIEATVDDVEYTKTLDWQGFTDVVDFSTPGTPTGGTEMSVGIGDTLLLEYREDQGADTDTLAVAAVGTGPLGSNEATVRVYALGAGGVAVRPGTGTGTSTPTQPNLAELDDSVANQITIRGVDANGAPVNYTFMVGAGPSAPGLTAAQAIAAVFAKMAADVPAVFSVNGADLVFAAPAPAAGSITMAMLATAVQTAISNAANVKPDWNAAAGNVAEILNKPTIDPQAGWWREYTNISRGTYALQQGATAGQTYATGINLNGGDNEVVVAVDGVDGAAIGRPSIPALTAGVNSVLTRVGLDIQIAGQRYRIGLDGAQVIFASETVNQNANIEIKASGYRLKDAADRAKNARWGRGDLPSDVAYQSDLHADEDFDTPANVLEYTRVGEFTPPANVAAGIAQATGIEYKDGDDDSYRFEVAGVGHAVLSMASIRMLQAVNAGDDIGQAAFTSRRHGVQVQGQQFYLARAANDTFLYASATANDQRKLTITLTGNRLELAADKRHPSSRWVKSRLPDTTVYADAIGTAVTAIEGLTGNDRLDATTLKNLPTGGGTLTDAAVLDLAKTPRTTADRGKALATSASNENALDLADIPDDAAIDARISLFARFGALVGASISKVQAIIDAFTGGGWSDVTGAAAAVPYVRTVAKATAFTPTDIVAGTYTQEAQQGARQTNVYVAVRIPKAYAVPLTRLRLRVGDDIYTENRAERYFPLDAQGVTKVTSSANYDYYSVPVDDLPLGDYLQVQSHTPFMLNIARVVLPGAMVRNALAALTGNDRLDASAIKGIPHNASRTFDEQFPGLTVNRTDTNQRVANADIYSPALDLDDNPHGEFHASLELTVAPVSDVNMGFERGKANQTAEDRQFTGSNIVLASDLAEESVFDNSVNTGYAGLVIFREPLYSLNTIVGYYNVLLVRNANNEVGIFRHYEGLSGGTGATFSAEFRLTFTPSDAPAVPAPLAFYNKMIALAAAAGAGTGNQTNRKKLNAPGGGAPEASAANMVLVDWGDVTLVADATATGGVTATAAGIAFAEAGQVWITGSLEFDPDQSGGAARLANHLRGKLTRGAVVTYPADMQSSTEYSKTSVAANALAQGPERQHCTFNWMHEAEAGDVIGFEWQAYLQTNEQVDIIPASSAIKVRIAN